MEGDRENQSKKNFMRIIFFVISKLVELIDKGGFGGILV